MQKSATTKLKMCLDMFLFLVGLLQVVALYFFCENTPKQSLCRKLSHPTTWLSHLTLWIYRPILADSTCKSTGVSENSCIHTYPAISTLWSSGTLSHVFCSILEPPLMPSWTCPHPQQPLNDENDATLLPPTSSSLSLTASTHTNPFLPCFLQHIHIIEIVLTSRIQIWT